MTRRVRVRGLADVPPVDGNVPPREQPLALVRDRLLDELLELCPASVVARQEADADPVRPGGGSSSTSRAEERIGHLHA